LPLRSPRSSSSAKSIIRANSCGSSGLTFWKVFGAGESP
jgi:hypothetical protein